MADDYGKLEKMVYPGRGIVVGMTDQGNPFIAYFITGRSTESRNRKLRFCEKTLTFVTEKARLDGDAQQSKGSSALLYYPAMIALPELKGILVSNGAQTNIMYTAVRQAGKYDDLPQPMIKDAFSEEQWWHDPEYDRFVDLSTYEPDQCHTPRIRASIFSSDGEMCTTYRNAEGEEEMQSVDFLLQPREGHLLSTYQGEDKNPLPSYTEEPFHVVVESHTAEQIANNLYVSLCPRSKEQVDFRVAVCVMMYDTNHDNTLKVARRNRDDPGAVVVR